MKLIPYGHQSINKDDIEAVIKVLKADFITQGPMVPQFEETVADYCDVQYGVAVNSATSALHIACRSLGLGKNDYLWTSANTFAASANCALYCGAKVDFVDIDPLTYNMSVDALESKLKIASQINSLPKIVIPVHFAGQSCEMEKIAKLADEYGFYTIEDASHAIGGKYKNIKIGSCKYSDMTIFSFHPVKIVTTGEGGIIMTQHKNIYEKLKLLRSHGITKDRSQMIGSSDGAWYYQQIDLGYNFRMTDIHAALGLSQMQRLNKFVAKRHLIARRYDELLEGLPIAKPWQHPDNYSGHHLYVIRLKLDEIKKTHQEVFNFLLEQGIGVNLHYIPVYRHPYYEGLGFKKGHCPAAEQYYREAVTLPIFPELTRQMQDKVVSALNWAITGESM